MSENTLDRIKKYLDLKGITIHAFEKSLSFSNGSFASQLKNNKTIGVDKLENILILYNDINPEWLLTGTGEMIKTANKNNILNEPLAIYKKETKEKLIPLVDVYAIGGFGGDDFKIEAKNIKEHYVLPIFKHVHIDFMIEVRGNSMQPKYSGGDIVACAIIKERGFIQWNKIHIIGTQNQGIIIKRLKKSDKEGFITAISDNSDYDPFDLPENEITGLALVVGGICIE